MKSWFFLLLAEKDSRGQKSLAKPHKTQSVPSPRQQASGSKQTGLPADQTVLSENKGQSKTPKVPGRQAFTFYIMFLNSLQKITWFPIGGGLLFCFTIRVVKEPWSLVNPHSSASNSLAAYPCVRSLLWMLDSETQEVFHVVGEVSPLFSWSVCSPWCIVFHPFCIFSLWTWNWRSQSNSPLGHTVAHSRPAQDKPLPLMACLRFLIVS